MAVLNDFCNEISKVELVDGIYLKRNDLVTFGDCNGGKAQSAAKLLVNAVSMGYKKVVTTGSRLSPQCEIVSNLCEYLGIECHLFMPDGKDTTVIENIKQNQHSILHRPLKQGSFQNVLCSYADKFAKEHQDVYNIPFGMQNQVNVDTIAQQCQNIPEDVKRIVVPVGSGMSLCGILQGLVNYNRTDIEVLGIITGGKDCFKIVNTFKPKTPKIQYILEPCMPGLTSSQRYGHYVNATIGNVVLDSIYEGKCREYIRPGDLFWIVGYHKI